MSNPPCAMRIISTLSQNDCKKLAKHVGCTPEEVNRMEKLNRHPKLHGKTLLQVLRIPDCGEATIDVVAAMLETAQIRRDNYRRFKVCLAVVLWKTCTLEKYILLILNTAVLCVLTLSM